MDSVEALRKIFAALGAALTAAPNHERRLLVQAIDDYAARFPDAFRNIRYGDAARAAAATAAASLTRARHTGMLRRT